MKNRLKYINVHSGPGLPNLHNFLRQRWLWYSMECMNDIFFVVSDKLLDYNENNCDVEYLEREKNERVNRGNRKSFSGQSG